MVRFDIHIAELLERKTRQYATESFIESDPVCIPHQYSDKEDVEIAGFLAATIAWGNRAMIIKNANRMMALLDYAPADFVRNATAQDLVHLEPFVHRTFNGTDFAGFVSGLQTIYNDKGGMEKIFTNGYNIDNTVFSAIKHFREQLTLPPFPERSNKHVANVMKKSSAKRINMFLRWMVRKDAVDFGLWKSIPKSALMLPLDVHTGRVGRSLGLLQRKQDDWHSVEEITGSLRLIDPNDPVKYDYALFGIGVYEKDIL